MNSPYSGRPEVCDNFVDLSPWQDDKTVLKNPHKGWYWHFIDNGYGRANYRQNLTPGDHMEDFPGLNHLYLRFDWGDIEKEEGVYDWSYIDSIMDEWGKAGYRFSFRICTYEGSGENEQLIYATPKWVYEAGAKSISLSGGRLEPVYSDPVYLEKLENFMREYGRKFNNDPRVEFIDIGTFGTWGESHTFNGSEVIYPNEVIYKHIDLHAKYFPDKILLLNDDMVGHRGICSEESKRAIVEYARNLGCGARDDSICVSGYSEWFGYNTIRSPYFFDQLSEDAPVDLEFEHYTNVLGKPKVWRDGFPFVEALRRTHATYAGFHGRPRPWLEKQYWITEYLANRLGYWYFIEGYRCTELKAGFVNYADVYFTNRGFSHCYSDFQLNFRLVDEQGKAVYYSDSIPNRVCKWEPELTVRERVRLDLRNTPAGKYTLECNISEATAEGDISILIGMRPELYDDGWYRLGTFDVK